MPARANWLDRLLVEVAPGLALRRARARYVYGVISNARAEYEGASKGRRMENWRAKATSANTETRRQLSILRDRSRDLVRNNAYASRAVSVIANNTVGAGILGQIKIGNGRAAKRMESQVADWLNMPACDADGQFSFYGIQHLVMRTVVESGECLIRRRRRRASDPGPLPLKLQVLEPDYLDTMKDGPLPNGGFIVQGIEFSPIGERVAYWLYSEHPGDGLRLRRFDSKRIPAEDIIHVYRVDRPGQVRGIPWCAPVIVSLRDFADFEDAQLMRQKIAACFSVFVESDDLANPTGAASADDTLESVEPGIIEHLPPGKSVKFATPPGVDGYGESARYSSLKIAAGYGVPYEALTGDLSNVNFSSGRMGWLEFARNIDVWRWHMHIPKVCYGIVPWIADALLIEPQEVASGWTPPRREMIDPTKEIPATRDAIRAGLVSQPEALRENGYDPDTVLAEQQEWNRKLDAAGIVSDSDPRKTSRSGGAPATGDTQNDRTQAA